MLLAAFSALSALLVPLDGPPVLNSPVYSLATLNEDGTTNMQILTYATPLGVQPRTWAISLYRPTKTHANFAARRSGVLQLLTQKHVELMYTLGGQSGTDVDKEAACAEAGFAWLDAPESLGDAWDAEGPQLLPGCAAYLRLVQVDGDELRSFGEGALHDLAVCSVAGALGSEADFEQALSTKECRAAGLITDRGKAIPPTV